jgi:hypothetical protein
MQIKKWLNLTGVELNSANAQVLTCTFSLVHKISAHPPWLQMQSILPLLNGYLISDTKRGALPPFIDQTRPDISCYAFPHRF